MSSDIKTLTAEFIPGRHVSYTKSVYRYDTGRVLKIEGLSLPAAYEVHFSNSPQNDAYVALGDENGAPIPDNVLRNGNTMYAWVYVQDETSGVTVRTIITHVIERSKPSDITPTPAEKTLIDQAIEALNLAKDAVNSAMDTIDQTVEGAVSQAMAGLPMMRVTSLDGTQLCAGQTIEAVGVPVYVSDVSLYPDYALADTGWYVFARISAPAGVTVTNDTQVTGAAAYIATAGADHIDVAVRFEVASQTAAVTIAWGTVTENFVFKATDLAVRNLDYRTTFYVYDLEPFTTWEYALTADTKFVADKRYFTKNGDEYVLAEVTADEDVPADTYYNHSKVIFQGMARNITYVLDEEIDCPQVYVLPEIDDDIHGCWFEFRLRHAGSFSSTLEVPEDVKIATEHTQAETKGINMIDLHYNDVGGVKLWRFLNTHSSIPA